MALLASFCAGVSEATPSYQANAERDLSMIEATILMIGCVPSDAEQLADVVRRKRAEGMRGLPKPDKLAQTQLEFHDGMMTLTITRPRSGCRGGTHEYVATMPVPGRLRACAEVE